MSRVRFLIAVATVATGGALLVPSFASAHHNTVECESPGVWRITNSEADKAESFTTDQGHAGDIPAGGSTTVNYSGTHLEVDATWTNGVTNHAEGDGDCTVIVTTTTTEAPSTTTTTTTTIVLSTTTSSPTSTLPVTTSSSTTPDTSVPPTTSPPAASSTLPPTSTPPPPTSPPPTTEPPACEDDPTTPVRECQSLPMTR